MYFVFREVLGIERCGLFEVGFSFFFRVGVINVVFGGGAGVGTRVFFYVRFR